MFSVWGNVPLWRTKEVSLLWMTFGPVVEKWEFLPAKNVDASQCYEGHAEKCLQKLTISSLKCQIKTFRFCLQFSCMKLISKHYTCNQPSIFLENYNRFPNVDRCKGPVSLNYSHVCHLTLKSTKKDCIFIFWVSVSFRQASNRLCPSWPLHSHLNQCNIQYITTYQHHLPAESQPGQEKNT